MRATTPEPMSELKTERAESMKAPDQSNKRRKGRRIENVAGGGGGLLLLGGALVAAVLGTAALRTHAERRRRPTTGKGDERSIKEGEAEEGAANRIGSTGTTISPEMEEGLRSLLQSPPAPPPLLVSTANHHHRIAVDGSFPVDFGGFETQQENLSEIKVTTTCGNSDLLPSSDDDHHPNDAQDMISAIIDKDVIVDESKVTQVQKKVVVEKHTSTEEEEEEDDEEEEFTDEEDVTGGDESDGTGDSSMESNAVAVWPADTIETTPSMDTHKLTILSEVTGGEEKNDLTLPPMGSGEKIGRENPQFITRRIDGVEVDKGTGYKALAGIKTGTGFLNLTRGQLLFLFLLLATLMVHWFGHHHLNVLKP